MQLVRSNSPFIFSPSISSIFCIQLLHFFLFFSLVFFSPLLLISSSASFFSSSFQNYTSPLGLLLRSYYAAGTANQFRHILLDPQRSGAHWALPLSHMHTSSKQLEEHSTSDCSAPLSECYQQLCSFYSRYRVLIYKRSNYWKPGRRCETVSGFPRPIKTWFNSAYALKNCALFKFIRVQWSSLSPASWRRDGPEKKALCLSDLKSVVCFRFKTTSSVSGHVTEPFYPVLWTISITSISVSTWSSPAADPSLSSTSQCVYDNSLHYSPYFKETASHMIPPPSSHHPSSTLKSGDLETRNQFVFERRF